MIPSRPFLVGVGLALTLSGAAAAADVVIDSVPAAARALFNGVRMADEVPQDYLVLTYTPRDTVDRALRQLRTVYTPAALKAIPAGVDFACPTSGTFHAHYAARVLDLNFDACTYELWGWTHTFSGPAQLTLRSDNFSPTTVAALTVGSPSADLLEDIRQVNQDVVLNHIVRNIRMAGTIPFGRPAPANPFEGTFSHTIAGFHHEEDYHGYAGEPGLVLDVHTWTAGEGTAVSGVYNYGDTSWKEDVTLNGGFRQDSEDWQPNGAPPMEFASVISGAVALRSLRSGNYSTDSEKLALTGSANYSPPWTLNLSCGDGGYTFATPVTLNHPGSWQGGSDAWNAGQFVANGAATFTFTANPRSSDTDMHVNLVITDVGTYDFDGNSLYDSPLQEAARCN